MSSYVIDLFFTYKGRASRQEWLWGTLALGVLAAAGILLFNNDSFDESANAVASAPTMAAVLWALLCLFAFVALCAKRLRDGGRPHGLTPTVLLAGLLAILWWGLGSSLLPVTFTGELIALLGLGAVSLPALVACAMLPTKKAS